MNGLLARNPDLITIAIAAAVIGILAWEWIKGVFWGLIIPDKQAIDWSCKWATWRAEIEHQRYWWIPVGAPALLLGIIAIWNSFKIEVRWAVFGTAVVLLLMGALWVGSFFIRRRP